MGENMELFEELKKEIEYIEKNKKSCANKYNIPEAILPKVKKVLRDLDDNHNHSWAIEMFNRNQNNLYKYANFYRGHYVTYKETFEQAYMYAKSLKQMGYHKGSEVPVCVTNIPEFLYLFLAISFIGAKIHVVADWKNEDYLIEILNKTESKTLFVDDLSYNKIRGVIDQSKIDNVVMCSLKDSLLKDENDQPLNFYEQLDPYFDLSTNVILEAKRDSRKPIFSIDEFKDFGKEYTDRVLEFVDLDDVLTITYTSGTTSPGRPKGVKQSNRSYITLSRFKLSDVSGMPTMKNLTVLSHIPTYTHMDLSCSISDTLYCGCTLAMEPFYSAETFINSLIINQPNFVPASVGFWANLCKKLMFDQRYQKVNMPYLMIPTVTGEELSLGEEKFFNYVARKHKFGTAKLPFPLAPVTFSIGGGTTESSGIFVTLYKSLQEKRLSNLLRKESLGLTPHKFAEVAILDNDGDYCPVNVPGLLVANSPCEMVGYTKDELNNNTHVVDKYGKTWFNLGTYSYKDKTSRVHMKGRMGNNIVLTSGQIVPFYTIEDIILLDTKNIMSCSVVMDNNNDLICHIELQPFQQNNNINILLSLIRRLQSKLDKELLAKLYFRFHTNSEFFDLDPSGKRSISTLIRNGKDEKTFSYSDMCSIFENTLFDNPTISLNNGLKRNKKK